MSEQPVIHVRDTVSIYPNGDSIWKFSDGSYVGYDADQQPVTAEDAHGNRVDPDDFPFPHEHYNAYVEQYNAEQEAIEAGNYEPEPEPEPRFNGGSPYEWQQQADQAWTARELRELERYQRDNDVRLTDRESLAYLEQVRADFDAGAEPDRFGAMFHANISDRDTHEGRSQAWVELLEDADRRDRGADPTDMRPARVMEFYDKSTHEGRQAYVTDKLNGYEDCDERSIDDISLAERGEVAYDEDDL